MTNNDPIGISSVLTQAYSNWQVGRRGGTFGAFALRALVDHGYAVVPQVDHDQPIQEMIRPYVQEAISQRKMGISLSDQIAHELRSAGYTLVQEQVKELSAGMIQSGSLRMTPLGEDGKPDPNKPAMVMSSKPVSIEFEVEPISDELKRFLFGSSAVRRIRYPHHQARRVIEQILPKVIKRYLEKSKDYGENAQSLGVKGQFADINRKFGKLKRAWWDGKPLTSEPAEEVAQDMIAHLLLALLFIDQETDDEEFDDE